MKHTKEEVEKLAATLQVTDIGSYLDTDVAYHEAQTVVMFNAAGQDYLSGHARLTPDDFTSCVTCGCPQLISVPPVPARYVESEHVGTGNPVKFFYGETRKVEVAEGDIPTLELTMVEHECEADELTSTVRMMRRLGFFRSISKDLGHVESPAFERSYLIAADIVDQQPKRLADGIRTKLEILEESTVVPNGGHFGMDRLLRVLSTLNQLIGTVREQNPHLDIESAIGRTLHQSPELAVALFVTAGHVCGPYVDRLLEVHLPSDGTPVLMVPEKTTGEG